MSLILSDVILLIIPSPSYGSLNIPFAIDDIFAADNPDFLKYAVYDGILFPDGSPAGIYDSFLPLNHEQGGSSVSFLDCFIFFSKATRNIEMTVYSKAKDPKYAAAPFNKYTHILSKLQLKTKLNVIVSETLRYAPLLF